MEDDYGLLHFSVERSVDPLDRVLYEQRECEVLYNSEEETPTESSYLTSSPAALVPSLDDYFGGDDDQDDQDDQGNQGDSDNSVGNSPSMVPSSQYETILSSGIAEPDFGYLALLAYEEVQEGLRVQDGDWKQETRKEFEVIVRDFNLERDAKIELYFVTNDAKIVTKGQAFSVQKVCVTKEEKAWRVSGCVTPKFTSKQAMEMGVILRNGTKETTFSQTHVVSRVSSRNGIKKAKSQGTASDLFGRPPVKKTHCRDHRSAGADWRAPLIF